MDFSKLKKASKSGSNFERLAKAMESNTNNFGGKNPDEYWKLTVDKAGNGSADIRFLPISPADSSNDDALEWVKYWDHGFEIDGRWYIEKSLTTLGQPDPLSEKNAELWNSGIDANKKLVSEKTKRRLHYVSNIYIVKDSANPENNGKVFKYEYGQKIFDRIKLARKPAFADEVAFDPFDMWTGATFKLRARTVDKQRNYDSSSWDTPAPISEDDSVLEQIWKQEYSLLDVISPKNFKSYEELKKGVDRVFGISKPAHKTAEAYTAKSMEEDSGDLPFYSSTSSSTADMEEDSDMDYFKSLID